MTESRSPIGASLARQVLLTVTPWLAGRPFDQLAVLDIGCGFGATAIALSQSCRHVVGLEPMAGMAEAARNAATSCANVDIVHADILNWNSDARFDLVVLDNVYEHVHDHQMLLTQVVRFLKPSGVFYIVVPNKLWPIEVHYGLPFLSYLPLRFANLYLRAAHRGEDYTWASFAPTYWSIHRDLRAFPQLEYAFTLPADLSLTESGASPIYRFGAWLIAKNAKFWALSKAFVVIGRRREL